MRHGKRYKNAQKGTERWINCDHCHAYVLIRFENGQCIPFSRNKNNKLIKHKCDQRY